MSGSIVSPALRARVRGLVVPIALAFGRVGLTPNALTLIGFGISVGAAIAASQQAWAVAGLLVIVGGIFDLFDGALARATNKVSRVGGFLDSVFDRAGEAGLYVGIAIGCFQGGFPQGAIVSAAAMAASFMVSYTRAKSESLGFTPGTGMANVGVAPREVRLVILTIGLLLAGISRDPFVLPTPPAALCIDTCPTGSAPLSAVLILITILATITTIQRILHVVRQPSADPAIAAPAAREGDQPA
jgi:phosphatidylglycerophosphate synthase